MKTKPRILVVEDDEPIRSALEVALADEGYIVRTEADGLAASASLEAFRPDLVILDVHFPVGPDGYTIAHRLRATRDVAVLFLTAADTVEDRLKGFGAGGDDFIAKPFSMAELAARVKALLRRAGKLSSTVRQIADLVIDDDTRTVVRGQQQLDLTQTEYQLLAILSEHPGQVLSKPQLLSRVWGFEAYDDNLVEVHMSALRRKLEAHGPRLIHTRRGIGYVLRAE